ncbi:hypothetical protein [Hyalangium versicolor]|uniref:hypothetical protein n=1 Tax=Hyalangium versicolor TaxID=2861190 RepID=UPI001CCD22DC|nr:hypothetical protein [Hyalangium versicolor]
MAYAMPVVTKEDNVWVIRIQKSNGKTQEYRCSTENQARQLALILARPEAETPAPRHL